MVTNGCKQRIANGIAKRSLEIRWELVAIAQTSGCRLVWTKSYAGANRPQGHKHDTMPKFWLQLV